MLLPDQDHPSPRGVVVAVTIDHEVTAVTSTVRVGMNNHQAILVTHLRCTPTRIALGKHGSHLDAGFKDEISGAGAPGIEAKRVVYGIRWDGLFQVGLSGRAVTPSCAVGRTVTVNDEAKNIVALTEPFGGVVARRFDEPTDGVLEHPALVGMSGVAYVVDIVMHLGT